MSSRGSRAASGPRAGPGKGPAINLTLRQGENIDDVLRSIFIMTPYSFEKATQLVTLLDTVYPDPTLRALLTTIGSRTPTETEIASLVKLLSDLTTNLATKQAPPIDERTQGIFQAAFPITINNFPLLEIVNPNREKTPEDERPFIFNWELLLHLLNQLPTRDELINDVIGYLEIYPGTLSMEDTYIFRNLLVQLRNNAPNYGMTRETVESLFPFLVITPEDIVSLRQMKYRDNSPVFDLINRQRLNDAVNVLAVMGLVAGRRVLLEAQSPSSIVFNLETPLLKRAKDHHDLEIKLLKTKPQIQTSVFKCLKCQSRNVMSVERQTRSADEPMTIFLSCMNCGNQWRIG